MCGPEKSAHGSDVLTESRKSRVTTIKSAQTPGKLDEEQKKKLPAPRREKRHIKALAGETGSDQRGWCAFSNKKKRKASLCSRRKRRDRHPQKAPTLRLLPTGEGKGNDSVLGKRRPATMKVEGTEASKKTTSRIRGSEEEQPSSRGKDRAGGFRKNRCHKEPPHRKRASSRTKVESLRGKRARWRPLQSTPGKGSLTVAQTSIVEKSPACPQEAQFQAARMAIRGGGKKMAMRKGGGTAARAPKGDASPMISEYTTTSREKGRSTTRKTGTVLGGGRLTRKRVCEIFKAPSHKKKKMPDRLVEISGCGRKAMQMPAGVEGVAGAGRKNENGSAAISVGRWTHGNGERATQIVEGSFP